MRLLKHFPDSSKQDDEDDRPRVAIVGKPNVGKSSLINKLAREDRVIAVRYSRHHKEMTQSIQP